ncbi:MAG: hypothetical protein GEV11_06855 [Streptosporangiales bacterium]|nr:hypothetical protein [Streptosporangiales bacterium]
MPLVLHISLAGLAPAPGGPIGVLPRAAKPAGSEANEPRGLRGHARNVPYSLRVRLPDRLRHAQAVGLLEAEGVRVRSSGGCADRESASCTSLEMMRPATLALVIDLKRRSGCAIDVTGGTEAGHAQSDYSHANGYKIDIAHSACVDRYITGTYPPDGVRGDGATLHHAPTGAIYASEPSHWDIFTP